MVYKVGFFMVCLFTIITARPQDQLLPLGTGTTPAVILSQAESIDPNGSFNFSYETSNGIKVEEAGIIKHVTGLRSRANFVADDTSPDEEDIIVQTGAFSYTAPDGTVISLRYTADENGFQPVGDHLPTPPPIPADILRSLPQNEAQIQQAQTLSQPQIHPQPQAQPQIIPEPQESVPEAAESA